MKVYTYKNSVFYFEDLNGITRPDKHKKKKSETLFPVLIFFIENYSTLCRPICCVKIKSPVAPFKDFSHS